MNNLEIYDKLRDMHNIFKEIYKKYDDMDNWEQNAIDGLDAVLYMVESIFSKE